MNLCSSKMSMSCNTKGQELFQIKRLNWHDSQINTRHDPGVEREKLLLKTILGQLANLNMDYILNNMLAILNFLILKNKLWLCKTMSLGKTHWSIIAEESWCLKLTLKWFSKNKKRIRMCMVCILYIPYIQRGKNSTCG